MMSLHAALEILQEDNLRALREGEGRGNSNSDMARLLDQTLQLSELLEVVQAATELFQIRLSAPADFSIEKWHRALDRLHQTLKALVPEQHPDPFACTECGHPLVDWANKAAVGLQGKYMVMGLPFQASRMTHLEALVLAAHIVSMAEPLVIEATKDRIRFSDVLRKLYRGAY